MRLIIQLLALIFLLLAGCSSNKPPNLTMAREEVKEYYESGKFGEEMKAVTEEAKDYFDGIAAEEKSTVVIDVDDTALSNYHISKKVGFGYVHYIVQEEVLKGESPAIPEMKSLYDFLINRGFKIIFLTGRKDFEYEATYKNLKQTGYTEFDTLIVRSPGEYELSPAEYKSDKRTDLVNAGYKIEGSIGDQWNDLEGAYTGKTFKVPNYLYLVK